MAKKKKKSKLEKVCERCGNREFTKKEVFKCRYCGYLNGVSERGEEIKEEVAE